MWDISGFFLILVAKKKKRGLSLDAFRESSHDQVCSEMAEASLRSGRFFCHRCSKEISPRLPVRALEAHLSNFKRGPVLQLLSVIFFGATAHVAPPLLCSYAS